jgi:ribosomal subunit interface protein
MTQILIQTTGFELTQALQTACEQAGARLERRAANIEKVEFFLESEGKREGRAFRAKIKVTRAGTDVFVEEKEADMYQAIRTAGKKAQIELDELINVEKEST